MKEMWDEMELEERRRKDTVLWALIGVNLLVWVLLLLHLVQHRG